MHPKTSVKHLIFATAIYSNIKLIAGLVEYKKLPQIFLYKNNKRLINTNYKINHDEFDGVIFEHVFFYYIDRILMYYW